MMNDFTAERRKSVSSERLKRYSFILVDPGIYITQITMVLVGLLKKMKSDVAGYGKNVWVDDDRNSQYIPLL